MKDGISILGAGAFGTALAISLARRDREIFLWARDETHAEEMQKTRENARRLKGIKLPEGITPTHDLRLAALNDTILLAMPMQALGGFLERHAALLDGRRLVACCKGIDLATGRGPAEIIASHCPRSPVAVLTGPSFAADIARGLPTALALACREEAIGKELQEKLTTPNIRLYLGTDVLGAELGGALKNVIAIACGGVMGMGLGESARAALMTRGYAEMERFALALGAQAATLRGLSGFGDLVLTCTSPQSRNYSFGEAMGRGEDFPAGVTVEGTATAEAVSTLARKIGVDMPITDTVTALLTRRITMNEAMESLLSRPLGKE